MKRNSAECSGFLTLRRVFDITRALESPLGRKPMADSDFKGTTVQDNLLALLFMIEFRPFSGQRHKISCSLSRFLYVNKVGSILHPGYDGT